MARWILALAVAALYVLHQDVWFWDTARPLVFGFLPIGLFYHAAYSVAVAVLMLLLIRFAWPAGLEREAEEAEAHGRPRPADRASGQPRKGAAR